MKKIAFKSVKTNLNTLFSRMSLANYFSTIFCIFICSFPEIHLFLINCNLFWFCNRLWNFSTHFCFSNNRFCSFLLVYLSFLLVSTCLSLTSRLNMFMSHFFSFLLIYLKEEKTVTKYLFLGVCYPQEKLQYAVREIFPRIKRVANVADDILTSF